MKAKQFRFTCFLGVMVFILFVLIPSLNAVVFAGNPVKFKPQLAQAKHNRGKCSAGLSSFDARRLNVVPPVRSQKGCGSCWAFAAASAYEINYCIVNNVPPGGLTYRSNIS